MPGISDCSDRHTVIDKRPGHYLSFPDICRAEDGRLVVAYREADAHVAKRSKLLLKASEDDGRTWSPTRILNASNGHCPRISLLSDGQLVIIDDASRSLYWSLDNGMTWTRQPDTGLQHGIPDRILELDSETFLTVAQNSRGRAPIPGVAQSMHENMAYLSENRGQTWSPLSVVAAEKDLALCETSVTRLPGGDLLALMRENSIVCEPMYMAVSRDRGQTWSDPAPTPAIGHRPCVGVTQSGRIMVTYRNVAPARATAAWLGTFEELQQGFMVHGVAFAEKQPFSDNDGFHVQTRPGERSLVQYALRPMTNPLRAKAELEVELRVDEAEENGCGVHMGVWWHIQPDRIWSEHVPEPAAMPGGQFNRLRFEYDTGTVRVFINDTQALECKVNAAHRDTRPITIGNVTPQQPVDPPEQAAQATVWRSMRQTVNEPRRQRNYEWTWSCEDGPPDHRAQARVLELKSDRFASWGDLGYSGWIQLPDGDFLCAYHHGGHGEPGYEPGRSAHIMLSRFREDDFGA